MRNGTLNFNLTDDFGYTNSTPKPAYGRSTPKNNSLLMQTPLHQAYESFQIIGTPGSESPIKRQMESPYFRGINASRSGSRQQSMIPRHSMSKKSLNTVVSKRDEESPSLGNQDSLEHSHTLIIKDDSFLDFNDRVSGREEKSNIQEIVDEVLNIDIIVEHAKVM